MATIVQTVTGSSSSGSVVSVPVSAIGSGNTVVVATASLSPVSSVIGNVGSGYTLLDGFTAITVPLSGSLYYIASATGGATSVDITMAGAVSPNDQVAYVVREYSGFVSPILDVHTAQLGNESGHAYYPGPVSPLITTNFANEILVGWTAVYINTPVTAGVGYGNNATANVGGNVPSVALEDQTVAAISTYNAIFTTAFLTNVFICGIASFVTIAPPPGGGRIKDTIRSGGVIPFIR